MLHYARRSLPRTDLFRTWAEARFLWEAIASRVTGIAALTLMPDHLHLLGRKPVERELGDALRAYAQWRNHHRGSSGRVFRRHDAPSDVSGSLKVQRNIRYIALNPCRAGLVDDPLAWPFSTHRDRLGLASAPIVRAVADPHREHAYVSGDPTVAVEGTLLPVARSWTGRAPDLDAVADAVSALSRRTPLELQRHAPTRDLFIGAALSLTPCAPGEVADFLSCGRSTVYRARTRANASALMLVERVLGDSRFAALPEGDLRRLPRWRRRQPIAS